MSALIRDVSVFLEQQYNHQQVVYSLEFSLEEMITNIIKYAYDDEEEHEISVTVSAIHDRIVICFEDDGRPFNPCSVEDPDMQQSISDRSIGGLGIFLVRKQVAEMDYRRYQGHNILTITIDNLSVSREKEKHL